jgi:hypothetical protein
MKKKKEVLFIITDFICCIARQQLTLKFHFNLFDMKYSFFLKFILFHSSKSTKTTIIITKNNKRILKIETTHTHTRIIIKTYYYSTFKNRKLKIMK